MLLLRKISYLILNIFILFIFFIVPATVLSDETTDSLSLKIEEYNKKLIELSKAKDTLANQIKLLTSQIELTQLNITQTQNNIALLTKEIATLSDSIGQLDVTLNQLSSAYIAQINQNYRLFKQSSPIAILLESKNFNRFLEQYKYLSIVQKNSQNTLINMETVRTKFDIQKTDKEKKQLELQQLQKKLSDQQANLNKQKNNKSNLLTVTKNDESKYQQLKKAAEEELSSLLKAQFVGKRSVKKGDPLGVMGNTGYSFGDHLHFGLYSLKESELSSWVYTNDIDPSDYLKDHMWPMSDYEITQTRGVTKYSYLYADRFHHGVDMVSSNKTVKAVNDGVAYFYRNANSSLGNHVKLFHPDGKMSLYLHLQ